MPHTGHGLNQGSLYHLHAGVSEESRWREAPCHRQEGRRPIVTHTTLKISPEGYASQFTGQQSHLLHATLREQRRQPCGVAGDPQKYLEGCTDSHQPHMSPADPQRSTERLPGWQRLPTPSLRTPLSAFPGCLSLCGGKEATLYSFFYGNLYQYTYLGKHLQTPDLKEDMQKELNL